MEYDYTAELIDKWTSLGHLDGVLDQNRVIVAQRLEAAHRRSIGQHGDPRAFERELSLLRREGYFHPLKK